MGACHVSDPNKIVREFHHTLIWPITLGTLSRKAGADSTNYWDVLKRQPGPWQYVDDTLLIEDESCQAGYEEFVYFLPYVQRFLYGVGDEGRGAQSSLHAFQRDDIASVEINLLATSPAIKLDVLRARLYFFYDVDVAVAVLEVAGKDIALADAVEIMDRFGRPYAPAWRVVNKARTAHIAWLFLAKMAAYSRNLTMGIVKNLSILYALNDKHHCQCIGNIFYRR
ncbi:MAG: hypothetical protein HC782_02465 [Gammaproteobacteria bacterium]|nr:hypothetical protein [Gammaproteobacteria bacterium]